MVQIIADLSIFVKRDKKNRAKIPRGGQIIRFYRLISALFVEGPISLKGPGLYHGVEKSSTPWYDFSRDPRASKSDVYRKILRSVRNPDKIISGTNIVLYPDIICNQSPSQSVSYFESRSRITLFDPCDT